MDSNNNPTEQYWQKRAAERMALTHLKGDKAIETLQKAYLKAFYEIDAEIRKIYKRYKKIGDLTDSQALQLLNSEVSDLERDILTKTLAKTEDKNLRKYLLSRLDSAPYKARITRKQAIKENIYMKLKQLGMEELNITKDVYVDTVKESYYRHLFDMQKGFGMGFDVAAIDDNTVKALINKPFLGKDFSQRIWGNTDTLTEHLYEVVVSGIVSGKAVEDMTKELSDRMAMGLNASKRLVRTELTYYNNQAEILSYKEADVKKYIFMAIFDLKTSKSCRDLDNKVFKVSEAEPGVNLPPMHPWCRSTTVGYFKDYDRVGRRAKDPKTGESYILPKDMSYNEWYDKYVVEKHGKEQTAILEKMEKNKGKDRAQYNKYKEVLGKDAPKSLKDFQKMKYNNSEAWKLSNGYYKGITKGSLSPLADFTLYRDIDKQIKDNLIGITTKDGITTNSHSIHFIERVIGSVEQKRSGVEVIDIKNTLINPVRIKELKTKDNGVSIKYVGEHNYVSINPETGTLIQVNPRGGKL